MIDYSSLPEGLREGMRRYVEHGIRPGGFLMACLENDFVGAVCRADDTNIIIYCLRDIASFLWCELPSDSWGSKEKVDRYINVKKPEKGNGERIFSCEGGTIEKNHA